MIVAAAIKTRDGKVHVAARHPLVFHVIARSLGIDYDAPVWTREQDVAWDDYKRDWIDGFVDDDGDFLTREEAMKHVERVGQTLTPRRQEHPGAVLTSEDLW